MRLKQRNENFYRKSSKKLVYSIATSLERSCRRGLIQWMQFEVVYASRQCELFGLDSSPNLFHWCLKGKFLHWGLVCSLIFLENGRRRFASRTRKKWGFDEFGTSDNCGCSEDGRRRVWHIFWKCRGSWGGGNRWTHFHSRYGIFWAMHHDRTSEVHCAGKDIKRQNGCQFQVKSSSWLQVPEGVLTAHPMKPVDLPVSETWFERWAETLSTFSGYGKSLAV